MGRAIYTWSDELVEQVLPQCRALFDELASHALGVADIAASDKCLWIPGLTAQKAADLYTSYITSAHHAPAVEWAGHRTCVPFFIGYISKAMIETHHTAIRISPVALHTLANKLRDHLAGYEDFETPPEVVDAVEALDVFASHVDSVLARIRRIPATTIEVLAHIDGDAELTGPVQGASPSCPAFLFLA
jgi:hypothetical protein